MYVDGLLAENHGDPAAAQWDPALAEMSGLAAATACKRKRAPSTTPSSHICPRHEAARGNGPFLAYLDVWIRPVTYIEDSEPRRQGRGRGHHRPPADGVAGQADGSRRTRRAHLDLRHLGWPPASIGRPAHHRNRAIGTFRPVLPQHRTRPTPGWRTSSTGWRFISREREQPACRQHRLRWNGDVQVVTRQRFGHDRRHRHRQCHEQRGQSGEPAYGAESGPRSGARIRAGQLDRDPG